jgi:CRISPR-associated endonuclease/helicase Cas3
LVVTLASAAILSSLHHHVALSAPFVSFWGKARPSEGSAVGWHPIAYHSLDVAACVERILMVRPLARRQAGRILRADPDEATALLISLAALHDIGKFATSFQAKRPDLWPAALGDAPEEIPTTYHTRDGFCLWTESLSERTGPGLWGGDAFSLTRIVQSVMGHHGRPVAIDLHRDVLSKIFDPAGRSAAEQFADVVQIPLESRPLVTERLRDRDVCRATWWVAGLITTADWIGSNEAAFPYTAAMENDPELRAYWEVARQRAEGAVRTAGLEPPAPAARRTFVELTGRMEAPTPAQRWASQVSLPGGPTLFVLEDVTGSGKTEAAQILVHRLMAAGRASGAFWAMPTQATANAMYERQSNALHALFDERSPQRPSLVLAHGNARMHEGFRGTVIRNPGPERASAEADDPDVTSEVACSAFLANSSRAALMADVGSGTVDQAILAILPSKFNTMRLFGLAEKVLVLDEIHAYDAYMAEELKALLRFHAELGACVIALSATLSSKLMAELIDEWRYATAQSKRPLEPVLPVSAYPLATLVAGDGTVTQSPIEATSWSRRTVAVRQLHDQETVIERLLLAAQAGAAAVWIRNTVDSCREGAAILRARGAADVAVFHARFAQVDRQRREDDVRARFGPSENSKRAGSILVATQVVEQSLDLDFDVMVSDLAPVDLLIQRSGRLWRHAFRWGRPGGPAPELLVLSPPFEKDPPNDWLDDLLPGTKWVYQDAGVLWRTLRALGSHGSIDAPDGLRDLIRQVYDDEFCPPSLQEAADRAQGKTRAATGTARQYTLKIGDGYIGESLIWASDVRVPTRLNDHQIAVRLGRALADGSIAPWANDDGADLPAWHRWALSEVRVSRRRLPINSSSAPAYRAACDAARSLWGRWEQEIPLVPLHLERSRWVGSMIHPEGERIAIEYNVDSGFSFSSPPTDAEP